MDKNRNEYGGGVDLATVLLIIFITLKLTGLISWPWIWVLSPLWITFALMMLVLLALVLIEALKH